MQTIPTLRDWTYLAAIAFLGLAYASGLISQAARASEPQQPTPKICLFHEMASSEVH